MMAAAQQHRKRRQMAIRKTESMHQAERLNGHILDQIWCEAGAETLNKVEGQNLNQKIGAQNLNYGLVLFFQLAIRSKSSSVSSCYANFAGGTSNINNNHKSSAGSCGSAGGNRRKSTAIIPSSLAKVLSKNKVQYSIDQLLCIGLNLLLNSFSKDVLNLHDLDPKMA